MVIIGPQNKFIFVDFIDHEPSGFLYCSINVYIMTIYFGTYVAQGKKKTKNPWKVIN